ncbi:MAG: carboxypeptidase-like regulatory domain-containing protein, partial [Acidobacteriota bacterium]
RRVALELAPLLRPFEIRRGLRLVMASAPLVVGRVVDAEGRPIAGAALGLEGSALRSTDLIAAEIAGDDESYRLASGTDGRFAAPLTREGRLDVDVRSPGFATLRLESIDAVAGARGRFDLGDLRLEAAAPVSGRVIDGEERPIAGAEIFLLPPAFERFERLEQSLRFRRASAHTDAAGFFLIDGLHAGEGGHLVTRARGFAPRVLPGIEAPTRPPLEIALDAAATVRGLVLGPSGDPVIAADVMLRRPFALEPGSEAWTRSGREGAFTLAGVPLGPAELQVLSGRYAPLRREIEIRGCDEDEELVLRLQGGLTLAGTVRDPAGVPVRGASLVARSAQAQGAISGGERQTLSDLDGRFGLYGLEEGLWTLEVNRDWLRVTREIELRADLDVEVVLDAPGEPLEGTVIDTAGAGVDGVRLQLRPERGGESVGAVSQVGGAFRFRRVPAGLWRLQSAFSSRQVGVPVALAREPGPLEVDGDPSTPEPRLEVVVDAGATLRGRVLGAAPHELPRIEISARGDTALYDHSRIPVDAGGAFEIAGLSIGRWRIQAAVAGTGRRAAATLEVLEGQREARVELALGGGSTLSGQVVADGEPWIFAAVTAIDSQGFKTRVRTDSRGRFEITGLEDGPVRLEVEPEPGAPAWTRQIELAGRAEVTLDLLE